MTTRKFVEFAHFMVDLFGVVASLSLKLQTKALILSTAISSIKTCISTIQAIKEHLIAGGALQQFQVCVEEQETDDDTTVVFQGIELKGGSPAGRFGSYVSLNHAIEKSNDVTVKELKARLLGSNKDQQAKQAVSSFKIFHHDKWPLSSKELLEFGI